MITNNHDLEVKSSLQKVRLGMASRGPEMMADRNRRACCPLPTRPRTLSNLKLQRLFQVFMFLFLRFEDSVLEP